MTRRRWLASLTVFVTVGTGVLLSAGNIASAAQEVLLSKGSPVAASSTEAADFPAASAVDGNTATRWSSQHADPQWIRVDLGTGATVSRVRLNWEVAYGKAYRVEVSDDAATWKQVYATGTGDGGIDEITGLNAKARYVRVYGTLRGTQWGYSLWELEVYGTRIGGPPPPKPFRFAPYVATFIGHDLPGMAQTSGQKTFTLGFVNSTGACQPVWSADDAALKRNVTALRAVGGDVIVSSGGWNADDLVSHCANGAAAAAAYQKVLDAYASDYLDLDPEHGDQHNNLDRTIVDRRNDALHTLQVNAKARGKTLHVSFTLGVSPDAGFNPENLYVLQSAVARGVEIEVVNPMTMDFYDGVSGSRMGERSITALKSVQKQLKVLYPARTDAQLWAMLAATPMIGQNDNQAEVFTLDDARTLVTFANQQHMARLSFWAVNRDNGGCPGRKTADATCSGISQRNYEFSSIFQGFTG